MTFEEKRIVDLEKELATAEETAELLGQSLSTAQKQIGELEEILARANRKLNAYYRYQKELSGNLIGGDLFYWLPLRWRKSIIKKLNEIAAS